MSRITTEWLNKMAARGAELEAEEGVVPMASRPTGDPLPSAIAMTAKIMAEQAGFDAIRERLAREGHRNKIALYKAGEVELFDTSDEAYSRGLRLYGTDQLFVVAQVERQRPSVTSLSLGVMVT